MRRPAGGSCHGRGFRRETAKSLPPCHPPAWRVGLSSRRTCGGSVPVLLELPPKACRFSCLLTPGLACRRSRLPDLLGGRDNPVSADELGLVISMVDVFCELLAGARCLLRVRGLGGFLLLIICGWGLGLTCGLVSVQSVGRGILTGAMPAPSAGGMTWAGPGFAIRGWSSPSPSCIGPRLGSGFRLCRLSSRRTTARRCGPTW